MFSGFRKLLALASDLLLIFIFGLVYSAIYEIFLYLSNYLFISPTLYIKM